MYEVRGRPEVADTGHRSRLTANRAALKMRRRQTDVARHLFAIVKRAVEHFADKRRRKFGPDALDLWPDARSFLPRLW